jgi:mannose-1-phosphate guanylyltransferase/mannose-6-phosphate isomerase
MRPRIRPVILAGGAGRRLWPLSREECPKPFLPLVAGEARSLLQLTVQRFFDESLFAPFLIVAQASHHHLVEAQLEELGASERMRAVILEPERQDTAAAALVASLHVSAHLRGEDEVLLLVPADHHMPDHEQLAGALRRALPAVQSGRIVAFGVAPSGAHSGYGYLQVDRKASEKTGDGPLPVTAFVEKPDRRTAERLLREGECYWNAGLYLFPAGEMVAAFRRHAGAFIDPCRQALARARVRGREVWLEPSAYGRCPAVSVDRAIMERFEGLLCQPLAQPWADLGGWDAVWSCGEKDDRGNVIMGGGLAHESRNSLIVREEGAPAVALVGLRDIVAVATSQAVLVTSRERFHDAGEVAKRLSRKAKSFLAAPPEDAEGPEKGEGRVKRPWGWYRRLACVEGCQVKLLHVRAGARLSLQRHFHRQECWIVLRGRVRVTRAGERFWLRRGQTAVIPAGYAHRLENPGTAGALLLEVQTGPYLGEDDILRLQDDYGRV